jgi:hypothetical protein
MFEFLQSHCFGPNNCTEKIRHVLISRHFSVWLSSVSQHDKFLATCAVLSISVVVPSSMTQVVSDSTYILSKCKIHKVHNMTNVSSSRNNLVHIDL